MLEKLADKTLNNGERSKLEKRLARLDGEVEQMKREREAVDRVEAELLDMFVNPELRKRYYGIVNLAEIEENEFNRNIPRCADTFEPEEEIKLATAARELKAARDIESKFEVQLEAFLGKVAAQ